MKKAKLLMGLLMLTSILTITACSGDKADAVKDTTDATEAAADSTNTTTDSTDTSTSGDTSAEEAFVPTVIDYSLGLDENGHIENVTALDYTQLPDYKNISVPSDVHTVSAELLQSEVDKLTSYFTTTEQVTDRAIVDGDAINIDYVGSVDGVEFEGGNTGGNGADVTIGVTNYIDDFLAQLIGHKPGESFDIEVTFPEAYGKEELNGKDAVFAITINYINETIVPELNDQFVEDNLAADYQWTTVEEMTAGVKAELETMSVTTFLQEFLLENSTVTDTPEEALVYQQNVMINFYTTTANNYGMSVDQYLAAAEGIENVDALIVASEEQVAEAADFSLIVQAIAEDAEIEITEEYIATYFLENAGTNDYSMFVDQYGLAYIKNSILQESVFDYVKTNATLE